MVKIYQSNHSKEEYIGWIKSIVFSEFLESKIDRGHKRGYEDQYFVCKRIDCKARTEEFSVLATVT